MNRKIWTLLLSSLLLFNFGCNNRGSSENSGDIDEYYSEDDGYEDGTYCADVTYYNPNTGSRNTYTLEVEVEGNELVKIYWNNGGWLDEDHFYAPEFDENGTCSFTSDKGYDYDIEITGKDCGYTDETSFQNDVEEDEEAVICPKCGSEKDEYDEYCYYCKRKIEDEEEYRRIIEGARNSGRYEGDGWSNLDNIISQAEVKLNEGKKKGKAQELGPAPESSNSAEIVITLMQY